MEITTPTLVTAPNHRVFVHWMAAHPETDPHMVEYVADYKQVAGTFKPIIVLNGGSLDPHVRALVRHPARAALVTHIEV